MMKIVQPGAAAQGYTVDCLVTPDHLPAGRPAPYMIYRNMTELAIPSVDEVVESWRYYRRYPGRIECKSMFCRSNYR